MTRVGVGAGLSSVFKNFHGTPKAPFFLICSAATLLVIDYAALPILSLLGVFGTRNGARLSTA